eukprot:746720-Hanusia_phi.AAC.5
MPQDHIHIASLHFPPFCASRSESSSRLADCLPKRSDLTRRRGEGKAEGEAGAHWLPVTSLDVTSPVLHIHMAGERMLATCRFPSALTLLGQAGANRRKETSARLRRRTAIWSCKLHPLEVHSHAPFTSFMLASLPDDVDVTPSRLPTSESRRLTRSTHPFLCSQQNIFT